MDLHKNNINKLYSSYGIDDDDYYRYDEYENKNLSYIEVYNQIKKSYYNSGDNTKINSKPNESQNLKATRYKSGWKLNIKIKEDYGT
jgi:hypothetical protein